MPLRGSAPFLMTALLFANGCASVPAERISHYSKPGTSSQPAHYQASPSSSWPPAAPVMASVQIGSPDVVPSMRPAAVPVISPEAAKPAVILPPPPQIKKSEIKTETAKPKEPEKEIERVKPTVRRESKSTPNKTNSKIDFLKRFDGINWGDAPKSNMNLIEEDKDALDPAISAYTVDHDDAPAFGLKPGMIIYYFNRNRFHKVEVIWEPDETEYQLLEKNILESFGEPVEAEVLGSRRWVDSDARLAIQFSDANAIRTPSPGHLMSLTIERTE